MPSSLTHTVAPIALAVAAGRGRVARPLLLAGIVASVIPDVDFIGGWLGIPSASDFAHRGAAHSLCFAALVAAVAAVSAHRLRATPRWAFAFVFVACASHGLFDMLSHGGQGIMYFWPFSAARHFLPWQPLWSLPHDLRQLLSADGAATLRAEARWIWLPCLVLAFAVRLGRGRA